MECLELRRKDSLGTWKERTGFLRGVSGKGKKTCPSFKLPKVRKAFYMVSVL